MSKIAVSSPSAGTATYTISAPAGSTDRTINLPDSNGTILTTATAGVPVNGPAFSAYKSSAQSISNAVFTKITFDSEEFDTATNFASSTFTPTVAGYYQTEGVIGLDSGAAGVAGIFIYKNGSRFKDGTSSPFNSSDNNRIAVSSLIYMNGSTDYLELYVYQSSGLSKNANSGANVTYFQASLARSAT